MTTADEVRGQEMTGRRKSSEDRPKIELRTEPALRDAILEASREVFGVENMSGYLRMVVMLDLRSRGLWPRPEKKARKR